MRLVSIPTVTVIASPAGRRSFLSKKKRKLICSSKTVIHTSTYHEKASRGKPMNSSTSRRRSTRRDALYRSRTRLRTIPSKSGFSIQSIRREGSSLKVVCRSREVGQSGDSPPDKAKPSPSLRGLMMPWRHTRCLESILCMPSDPPLQLRGTFGRITTT